MVFPRLPSVMARKPLKYVAELSHVREVSLLGTADLAFWKSILKDEDLILAENNNPPFLMQPVPIRLWHCVSVLNSHHLAGPDTHSRLGQPLRNGMWRDRTGKIVPDQTP